MKFSSSFSLCEHVNYMGESELFRVVFLTNNVTIYLNMFVCLFMKYKIRSDGGGALAVAE